MALVSVTPLVSRWGVHKSVISSKNHRLAFCQQLSSTGILLILKKTVTPKIRSISTDAQRRTGNRHSNVWDDDVIHSLSTSYAAPAHRERAETLIEDIKHLFLSAMKASCTDSDDLIERLQMVDTIECLGIDRHFQPEIKVAMDYVYSCWNERGIGPGSRDSLSKDLNSTALGFRALRMHRYNVSPDVFENFKDENGHFFCTSSGEEGSADEEVRSMLSLFRASNISFPGEKVMEEAKTFTTQYLSPIKTFTTQYLSQVLTRQAIAHVDQSLRKEVKYALEFPWHCTVPRWEARNFIEIYEQNYSWLKSNICWKLIPTAQINQQPAEVNEKGLQSSEVMMKGSKASGVIADSKLKAVEARSLSAAITALKSKPTAFIAEAATFWRGQQCSKKQAKGTPGTADVILNWTHHFTKPKDSGGV